MLDMKKLWKATFGIKKRVRGFPTMRTSSIILKYSNRVENINVCNLCITRTIVYVVINKYIQSGQVGSIL